VRRLLVLLVLAGAAAVGLVALGNQGLGPVVITREDEQKVILLLGDVRKVTQPGWTLRLPVLEDVQTYDRRLLHLNTKPLPIQTRDEERIVVDNYVVWRIADPVAFRRAFPGDLAAGQIAKAGDRIDGTVANDVREVIGQHTLPEVLKSQRVEIMQEITGKSRDALAQYGIDVVDVRINRTELPEGTEKNVFARMQTERERLAKKKRAEGEESARRIRAEADRDARVTVAEAHRDGEIARGQGDAEATRIYAEAYGSDPDFYAFQRSLAAYRKSISENTTWVTSSGVDFFRFLGGPQKPKPPPPEPVGRTP
jgi:membrane protease subunit HflC